MKKLSKISTIAMAGLLGVGGAVALAQSDANQNNQSSPRAEQRGHHGKRGFHKAGRLMKELNLTDEQKAQMKQIRQNFSERTTTLRNDLRARRQELRQLNQGAFNESLTAQKLAEMSGLQAKLMGERFKLRQEMLAVLTPEQKTKFEQRREQFKARHAGGHRHGQ
jgi:protein CpxP